MPKPFVVLPSSRGIAARVQFSLGAFRRPVLRVGEALRLFPVLVAAPFALACRGGSDPASITAKELLERLGTENAPIVLDVRTPVEYASGHVPGAYNLEDRMVPYRIEELKRLADREIVVYCEVGPRARWVEGYLRQNGFTKVRHLVGDFSGWRRNGFPVE